MQKQSFKQRIALILMIFSIVLMPSCAQKSEKNFSRRESPHTQTEKRQESREKNETTDLTQEAAFHSGKSLAENKEKYASKSSSEESLKKKETAEEDGTVASEAKVHHTPEQSRNIDLSPTNGEQQSGDTAPAGDSPAATDPPPTEPAEVVPATIKVSLSVDCMNAVQAGNEIAEMISADGYLFGPATFEVEEGSTALDLLLQSGLTVSTTNGAFGSYIVSIQSLAEFAVDGKGGWMYLVNGQAPHMSTDSYILQPGDIVEFRYTVHPGDV